MLRQSSPFFRSAMAISRFPIDPPPRPIPDFHSLSFNTSNATDDILLYGLKHGIEPKTAIEFKRLKEQYELASRRKMHEVLTTGDASRETLEMKRSAFDDFARLKGKYMSQEDMRFLWDPISRKQFDISPYEIPGKATLAHPFPGVTAAMDGVWPGYDKPIHFEQYPFLLQYGGLMHFLRKHHLLFHLPETFARYGGVFIPHPYVGDDLNAELRRHLERSDLLFHTAPVVYPETTKEELDLVLSYCEDDFVAVVMDREGGSVIGTVGAEHAEGRGSKDTVKDFFVRNWHSAPEGDLTAEQAYVHMETADIPYMLKLKEGQPPRIVTQTTAALSHFLPPFKHKNGLGSIAYFRISNIDESNATFDRLLAETDGIPGAIVETAHADTEFVRRVFRIFRKRMQDMFMMSGTVIDPRAVDEFMLWMRMVEKEGKFFKNDERQDADGMKIGIAEGRACRTSNTGLRITNAYAGLLCGASMWKDGTMILDGWGYPDEFTLGLSAHSARARQRGGTIVGRRECPN